ncbi:MAG: FprA family A-type flavoprotein [Victivallaceae bacterium]
MTKEFLKAIKITEKVYWVGAVDWDIRNFHGYTTDRGSTYNAFLVLDEKITLIDTVKAPFFDELMARISSVIDPKKIDYIVSNHAEMDHSGALPAMIQAVSPEKVFASPMGEKNLKAHFGNDLKIDVVKTGDSVSLGQNTISFIETKMLHWPDSMISYLSEDKILFSQDAFGMHLAGSKLFADEYEPYIIEWEAKKYYANILMPYSQKILELLNKLPSFNLDIKIIAPDHGPLWRENINYILDLYRECALHPAKKKALIFYDTMWKSTETMAKSIGDGITSTGVEAEVAPLLVNDRSYIVTRVMDAAAIVVGSSTMNNNFLPPIADILTYLRGLKPQHLLGAAFGSYGWSGESVEQINGELKNMGVELLSEGIKVKYVPTEADFQRCFELGQKIGLAVLAKCLENKS